MAAIGRGGRSSRGGERLRSSPHVVGYWRDGQLLLHHIATGGVLVADPAVVRILHFFRDWRPVEELTAQWPSSGRRSLRTAIHRLTAGSFLQRSDRASGPTESNLESWGAWNPIASLFHFSTKEVRWFRGRERDAFEIEFARKTGGGPPPPAPIKRLPAAPRWPLPRANAQGQFAEVLLGRRTWRGFGSSPVDLGSFAQLLDLTFGVQFWGEAGEDDRVAFKTSPSGGARHPIEAYVLALRVKGLPRGLYHYVADAKELELVRKGATPKQVETYLTGQWFYRPAAAVVFMTAVVARELWRYPHPRSYRTVLFEAGHLCQTFCLVATWLGLAPFCTAALADSRIERDLGVDGVSEVLLYAAGVGTRPPGGQWVQWPEHLAGHPYLPPTPHRASPRSSARQAKRARPTG